MNAAAVNAQAIALLAERTTDELLDIARHLDGQATLTQAERRALAWTLDAILVRHPEIDGALDAWVMSDDSLTMTYTSAVVAALNGRTW